MSSKGKLAVNILHFARLLRAAGLPIGTNKVLQAIQAVEVAAIGSKSDFFWTLHALFVTRADQRWLFRHGFDLFWRDPESIKRRLASLVQSVKTDIPNPSIPQRLKDALARSLPPKNLETVSLEIVLDAAQTWSGNEKLRSKDFEQMQADEIQEALKAIQTFSLPASYVRSRRFKLGHSGTAIDPRQTLKRMTRYGGNWIPLVPKRPLWKERPLVVLCDISGSMDRYARVLLHFVYRLLIHHKRVHAFVFGTRLTCITRQLKHRDVDVALKNVSQTVPDWAGGTRIGSCLHAFNHRWNRRVLGQGALLLLITDGLDRDNPETLRAEMERLKNSCHRLIWLNPLLRYAEFSPQAGGIRVMLPFVDEFRSVHCLDSLTSLIQVLNQ